ncbi:Nuclear transport factor 2 [Camellia lanceoleosa]|uniref:Nuclear transport factor 2 n=1 Tax=Camellia lanceoleosa TaxID=1840588 RepID=A0ACC0FAF1_9ERIC|nr:Nuclear transport factor 2 [Camellia lanceoleosa]
MAMQAASPAAALPSAHVVGDAFVEQYYRILHESPELVYKFYQDSSVLSRPNSNGVMTSVTTMQAINEKILSLDYGNYKAEIKTADDNVRKKFTQTFFLAPHYFVLNDVFRYVEESESLEVINSVTVNNGINNNNATMSPLPLDPEPIRGPDHPPLEPVATFQIEDLNNGPEVCDPSDHEEGSVLEEEVKVNKVTKASARVYVPTSNTRVVPANADLQSLGSAKPSPELEASAPTGDSAPQSTDAHEEVEGYSIHVRNLPVNAMVAQLEEEFRKFGPIKRGGIQVRSNKQGFCFGFVEFESLISMQSAIKASPLTIGVAKLLLRKRGLQLELAVVRGEGTLRGGVDSGMTTSGAVGTLVVVVVVVGALAGTSSETRASFQVNPRAQADTMERIINKSIRMEAEEVAVKVG